MLQSVYAKNEKSKYPCSRNLTNSWKKSWNYERGFLLEMCGIDEEDMGKIIELCAKRHAESSVDV